MDAENTPFIPASVYDRLPRFLKNLCEEFKDNRERDVFLTSVLGILSGCFDTVSGSYAGNRVHASLYAFVIAPPASGKGSMSWAKHLANPLHNQRKQAGSEAVETVKGHGVLDFFDDQSRLLYIPANISAAALIDQLNKNGGNGIICETEADTLATTLTQEWGKISDILRKAFHHETVSLRRKTKNEYVEINNPRLAMVLTGTPGQLKGVIPSTENGLFSRFVFYIYHDVPEWRKVSPSNHKTDREEMFEKFGKWLADRVTQLGKGQVEFQLTDGQWEALDAHFKGLLENTQKELGAYASAIATRLGLITFRLAMVLSATRRLERVNKDGHVLDGTIECIDADFDSAMELSDIFYRHALATYDMVPSGDVTDLTGSERKLYNALPDEAWFTRNKAVSNGVEAGMPLRTGYACLHLLVKKGYLERDKEGLYRKIK
ncbi:DUF3987 domain-containing protein [Larkinella rosea]|uniref:DUF3987 domain-containing protein n=1 Tax=Larkinella rosea TaxID=2025312 RepID=A0A3P1C206_9BACT|nr:DUF3987 domain-containing protein [Larkinella rosea]RRB06834.1 DUF3987 domain-containing protein [Larkinella rosea]